MDLEGAELNSELGREDPRISPNGDEDDKSVDGFDKMMNNIVGNDSVEIVDNDEEILRALEDVEVNDSYGYPVTSYVAEAFSKTGSRKLSKETEDKLKQSFKIPENCKSFRVPKVNPEIWLNLKTRSKVTDLKLQQVQSGLSIALTTLAIVSDKIAKAAAAKIIPKDVAGELLKTGLNGANLIGHQMQELTARRRLELKPFLNPDYNGICTAQIPTSEVLFGDTLMETLKSSKAAATVLRNTTLSRNRVMPYNTYQRSGNLNYQRPFTNFRGRGNGHAQQRPRGSYNMQYAQRRPYHQNFRQRNP